jgi:hypothetical protein
LFGGEVVIGLKPGAGFDDDGLVKVGFAGLLFEGGDKFIEAASDALVVVATGAFVL